MSVVLAGHSLKLAFGPTNVLQSVDVSLAAGEIVAVMGPSSSGRGR